MVKLSRSMDDDNGRIPNAGGGEPVPALPTGSASGMGPGLLKANGALQPGGNTSTLAGNWAKGGEPQRNR